MKRFHVHLRVAQLGPNLAFYSAMFGQAPSRQEVDYAKWMLDDPPLNFAISTRGQGSGIDHLGIQVDSQEELQALQAQAHQAGMAVLDAGETTCCYARSDKHWLLDPQGMAWEHFHSLDHIPVFSETPAPAAPASAPAPAAGAVCCASPSAGTPVAVPLTFAKARPGPVPGKACC